MTTTSTTNGIWGAVAKYGAATVIAIFLVWQLAAHLPVIEAEVVKITAEVEAVQQQHMNMKEMFDKKFLGENVQQELMIRILRQNCLNTAETRDERANCNL